MWLGFIAWIVFLSCCDNRNSRAPGSSSSDNPPRRPSPNSGSGCWFPGGDHHHQHDNHQHDPPPPYPKYQQDAPTWQNWKPGFWTDAALDGLANHLWNGRRTAEVPVRQMTYDWERVQRPSFFVRESGYRQPTIPCSDYDRGEGRSNLGPMRRSTGLGGSSFR